MDRSRFCRGSGAHRDRLRRRRRSRGPHGRWRPFSSQSSSSHVGRGRGRAAYPPLSARMPDRGGRHRRYRGTRGLRPRRQRPDEDGRLGRLPGRAESDRPIRRGERKWTADPWIDPEETLEPDDYDEAPKSVGIDRGHQALLAAFFGRPFVKHTNALSELTPQGAGLSQAAWQRLEAPENDLPSGRTSPCTWSLGPLFERVMPPLVRADERDRVHRGAGRSPTDRTFVLLSASLQRAPPRSA